MSLPQFAVQELGHHTDVLILEKESFLFGGSAFVGLQYDGWQDDQQSWNQELGLWSGPAPCRATPRLLQVVGASTLLDTPTQDLIYNVASGAAFVVSCGLMDWQSADSGTLECSLYSASDNTLVQQVLGYPTLGFTEPTTLFNFPIVAPGSYYVLARLTAATRPYQLPPGYTPNPAYQYTEGGVSYIYDPVYNVGRLPADLSSPFRAQRVQIVAANQQLDVAAWADYLIDGANPITNGDYAAIRVQVGSGSWTRNSSLMAGPLRALESVGGGVFSLVAFDPQAINVSASTVRADGTLLVAGNRIAASGPELSLWSYDGTTWTLLGKNTNRSNGWCQCALKDHGATDVRELIYIDGAGVTHTLVYVLSRCSLHIYNPNGDTVNDRLPGSPLATEGEPGGEALRFIYSQIPVPCWTTEGFWQITSGGHQGFVQFYNEVTQQIGVTKEFLQGTVYQGANTLEEWKGQIVGILQDKPFDDPTARQYLCALDGSGGWRKVSPMGFLASAYRLQHIIRCGPRLIMIGYAPLTGLAVCSVLENGVFQEYQFNYRVRRMTRSLDSSGNEVVTAIAALPGTDSDNTPQRVIQFTGERLCVDAVYDGTDRFTANDSDFVSLGLAVADLPAYLSDYDPVSESWTASDSAPTSGPYLQKTTSGTTVSYVVHGTLPYDVGLWGILHTCTGPSFGLKWKREATCASAACVYGGGGYTYQVVHRDNLAAPWNYLQVSDVDPNRSLAMAFAAAPVCWLRRDSVASQSDLSTYTERVTAIDGIYPLSQAAKTSIDVVFLKPHSSGAFHAKVDPVSL